MDKHILKNKLKKYLFFISVVFFSVTFFHLLYTYIYSDSLLKPQKGGTISESFVGKIPNLNPLKYNSDNYNNYINHILYRSLSTYNNEKNTIIPDLAECDINDTKNIKCYLVENIKWSDGSDITVDDVKATFETIKKYNTNPVLQKILNNIEIKTDKNLITFISNIKDINILNILFQEILPKKILDNLNEDTANSNFSPLNGIYSGHYVISESSKNLTQGNTKIFLEKNELYIKNPAYIDNIILKIYKDTVSLLKDKNLINIFHDKNHLIGNSIPKLKEYNYILPQYVAVFLNKDKIKYPNIRNFILKSINKDEIVSEIGKKYNKRIDSPFLDENLKLSINQNLSSLKQILNSIGYYKKSYYINKYNKYKNKPYLYSQEAKIKDNKEIVKDIEKQIDVTKIKNSITKENYNQSSNIIYYPERVDKYNFITKPNINLKGKVEDNEINNIYINDEKIQNYKKGDKNFEYRLEINKNIKLGRNDYKIYFEKKGNKQLKEELTFFYDKNKKTLEKKEIDLITELINKKIELKKQELLKTKKLTFKKDNISFIKNLSSKQKELEKLSENFYYNKDFIPYSINLFFVEGSKEIEQTANSIKKQLENIGIKVYISPTKLKDITKLIKENKETYDLILTGINLGYFPFDISKYFYSGQVFKGTNFSKIKNSSLDNILEVLKSYPNLETTKKTLEQKEILKILKKENIFMPLYSPIYSNLVLEDIKGYKLNNILLKNKYRFDPLVKSYILKQKIIKKENKNFGGFFHFLINKLF